MISMVMIPAAVPQIRAVPMDKLDKMQTVMIGILGGIREDKLPAAEIHPRESDSSYFAFLNSGAAILQNTALDATEIPEQAPNNALETTVV